MTESPDSGDLRRARRGRAAARRRPATFFGVVGEILITVGVLTLLFVAWQLWIGDWIGAAQKNAAGQSISEQWAREFATSAPDESAAPSQTPDAAASPNPHHSAKPVILKEPKDAQVFGVMYIPRFGKDYNVPMAGGVTRARTLDPIGIGHYPGTPMPGATGNVALAAHRTTFGKPFNQIAKLRLNDPIIIETKAGWYVYRFRNLEYVKPDAIDVLNPVPQEDHVAADGKYLTMTSCSPMYYKSERIVAYSVFESFTPRADGPPSVLKGVK